MAHQGIPTTHAGTRFRSRLEARWAHLFDEIGWQWEYEPYDLDNYVPDFLILGGRPLLIEVKPAASILELQDHTAKPEQATRPTGQDIMLVGASPLLPVGEWHDSPSGLMLQWDWGEKPTPGQPRQEFWNEARWHRCGKEGCGQISVSHQEAWFVGYPCGHHDGDHYLDPLPEWVIAECWARARNATQWRP